MIVVSKEELSAQEKRARKSYFSVLGSSLGLCVFGMSWQQIWKDKPGVACPRRRGLWPKEIHIGTRV